MNLGLMNRRAAQKSLPYDAEIEYIGKINNATSSVNAPILILNDLNIDERTDCFEICFQNTKNVVAQDRYLFSSWSCLNFYANSSRNYAIYLNGGWQYFYSIVINNDKHVVKVDYENGKGYVDGTVRKNWGAGSSNIQGVGLHIFYNINNCKLFYLKYWKNGVLILDLIPVRKGNVGYLWDKVNQTRYDLITGKNTYVLGADK